MKSHWRPVVLSALLMAVTTGIAAAQDHGYRHKPKRAPAAAPQGAFAPARMIEVRPGVFVSSYDCVIDGGYGRYRLCSQGLK